MSAITAKASRKMKKYAVLTREPRCFLGSFDFSWEQRKVQDVADRFDNLRIPVAANLRVHGTTPYYGANGIQDYVEGFTHDGEFVLVAEDGANDLKNYPVKCVNGRIWVNNHAHILQGKAGISDNSFLAFAISQSDIESLLVGGSRAKLNAETLMSIEFKLPCLQEQYRIGEYLTQLDHLITLHQRKCVFLFGFFQAFISMIFTASTFSWEQRKLGEIGSVSMCRRIFKEQTSETGDIPFYKIGTFGADPDAFISRELFEEYKSKYPYPQKGDILISASGSIGRAVEFAGNNEYFQDSNIVWLNHDERLSNPFLKCFYSVVKWAGIEGSTIKRLYNDNILNTVICMPSVPEQKRIGLFFENLDNLITLHQRKFEKLTNVKKSMLEKMFPQNGSSYPEIRFKGFTDPWEQRKLSEIADKVTEKNAGLQYVETFTNSAEFGIISQRDFFDHDIAKLGSLDGYYIVKNEDFVYNPRISTSAPVGPINRNKLGRTGVMSPLYTVFRPHDVDTTYLEHFFKCAYWHSFMNFNGDSGARSDRFSIKDDVFFQMPIPLPYIDEQRKIGELLTRLDHLITLHQRKFEKLTNVKKSMLEKMFPQNGSSYPEIRFKGFTDPWEQRKLSEIADKVTEKNAGLQYVETFTNSAEFGIISQRDFFDHDIAKLGSLDGYYIVKNEDFVYNPRISTSAPVGPINRNKLGRTGVMSPLYTVFRPHDVDTTYLEHFFKCAYWHSFMNFNGDSGARSDRFSIKDDVFFQMPIPLPYIDEQRKIGELLTRLDHLITLHQRKGKAAVTGCSNDANNSKGVYCKARDFGYKCCKKVESP